MSGGDSEWLVCMRLVVVCGGGGNRVCGDTNTHTNLSRFTLGVEPMIPALLTNAFFDSGPVHVPITIWASVELDRFHTRRFFQSHVKLAKTAIKTFAGVFFEHVRKFLTQLIRAFSLSLQPTNVGIQHVLGGRHLTYRWWCGVCVYMCVYVCVVVFAVLLFVCICVCV